MKSNKDTSEDTKKDILIQQEGQNVVVTFQTEKAKKAFYNSGGSKTVKDKLEILSSSVMTMMAWAITHDLTADSKVKLIIKPKG